MSLMNSTGCKYSDVNSIIVLYNLLRFFYLYFSKCLYVINGLSYFSLVLTCFIFIDFGYF